MSLRRISLSGMVGFLIISITLLKVKRDQEEYHESRETRANGKKYITYADWAAGRFDAKTFYPKWVSDSEYATRKSDGSIVKVNIKTNEEVILLKEFAWNELSNPYDFSASADMKYIAINYNMSKGYAHYMTTFSVAMYKLSNSERVEIPDFPTNVQKIKWNLVGHALAFVDDFDVYVTTNFSKSPIRLTWSGMENVQFNGIADWIHEAEVTKDDAFLWWSTDGSYLAFATLNQTVVSDFVFARFVDETYPKMVKYSYPKPGTSIPFTEIFIANSDGEVSKVNPSATVVEWGDYYLNSVLWMSDTIINPTWKNRYCNQSVTETCMLVEKTWTCTHMSAMTEMSETGWLGHYNLADLFATGSDHEYATIRSDESGYLHLVFIDTKNNTKEWRTSGKFEVTDTDVGDSGIHFYDKKNDWVYHTSTEQPARSGNGLPRIRHVWRVRGHGANTTRECISCHLNDDFPERCNWVDPSFGPGGKFVVFNCGGTANGIPLSTLHEISTGGVVKIVKILENNDELQDLLDNHYIRTKQFGSIQLPDVPDEIFYYALHLPPNFDSNKKYPMLVYVYSGPAYQSVMDNYNFDWSSGYIASSGLDVIVLMFDGRGTGFRGDRIMHMVYRRLGEYEPIDQIEAAKQISNKFPYIDKNRIAIWGRSYGGYATARTVAEDSDGVFKCGISVAPVTDWRTYSTLYTERYMGLPSDDNEEGYNKSTAIQKIANFGKHYYTLVHGTSDENVHFLHSARLSKALIDDDIDFSAYFAGDETHSFTRYRNGYSHHYKLLTRHVKTCFQI